jgi:hypothetical protein
MVYTKSIQDSITILVNSMNQLTPDEKHLLKQNCENVIRIFEPDFDQPNFNPKDVKWVHPIWGYIGHTPGIAMLGDLGEALQNLRNMKNFSTIVERLKHPDQFNGAFDELHTGNNLFKSGIPFTINSQSSSTKSPDFEVHFEGREINLEITEKEKSTEYIKAERNASKITNKLFDGHASGKYSYAVTVNRPLSNNRTQETIEQLELLEKDVQESGFEEYHIPDFIDLYVFKPEFKDKVPVEKRQISYHLPQVDEISRFKLKIRKKSQQLDDKRPGVLLILDDFSWLIHPEQNIDLDLKLSLAEYICDFENISALIIQNNYFLSVDSQTEFMTEEKNCFYKLTNHPKTHFTRQKLVFFNEFAKNPLLKNEIELLNII